MTDSSSDLRHWDAAAGRYMSSVGGPFDSFYRRIHGFLWDRLGSISGLDLLDLGCGHGWLAEELRLAGARVNGIDGSHELLAAARLNYPEIDFRQHDLTLGLPQPQRHFDRIVAHMVLMDIPLLEHLIADVAAALRPGGVFVFSILHPAFFSRTIVDDGAGGERYRKLTGYLEHETRWIDSFGGHHHYHRPLSWYFDQLIRQGLVVTGLHEPPSLPHDESRESGWTEYQKWFSTIPTMLAVSCTTTHKQTNKTPGEGRHT